MLKKNITKTTDNNVISEITNQKGLSCIDNYSFIFDLDGVITDTTGYHFLAWAKAFKNLNTIIGRSGIKINKKIYADVIDGAPRISSIQNILRLFGVSSSHTDVKKISSYKNEHYMSLIKNNGVFLHKDAINLIKNLRTENAKIGIATSSKNGHEILEIAKIENYFDFVATGREVQNLNLNSKPAPDIFNLSIENLGVDLENVFIFEDSKIGLRAAIATGCKNVVYADRKNLKIDLEYKYRLNNLTNVLGLFYGDI